MRGGVAFVATFAAAACGSQPSTPGRVAGVVRGWGGPAVLIHGKPQVAINGAPMTHQSVTLTSRRGVVHVTTDGAGRFSARVAPGTYVVTSCASPATAVVHAGRSLSLDLRCYFP
jgi:hypothetical protein